MSGALIRESIVKIVDPRTDLSKDIKYVVEDGSSSVTWVQSDSNQAGGNASQFTFSNADPPGPGVIIDKKVMIRMGFRMVFTGTPDAGVPLIGYEAIPNPAIVGTAGAPVTFSPPLTAIRPLGVDAPRAFPAAQIMNSISVTINNATVTEPVFDYIEALLRYNAYRDLDETQFSTTLDQQDQYQQYSDFVYFGSARNVLGGYGEQGFYTNRGGFAGVSIISNPLGDGVTPVSAILELDVMEPLFISPLDFGMDNQRGLVGVQNFQVSVNVGDLSRLWSHDGVNGQTITSFSATIGSTYNLRPSLQFNYLTPKLTQPLPEINIFPYYNIDRFSKTDSPLASGVQRTGFSSDSRNLLCIPKRLYVYVRQSNNTRTFEDTDTYARIDRLSIDFINKNNLINGANTEQLYQMSVKNGCKLSWSQWDRYVGSVCCIDFGQDVSLVEDQAVGLISSNLQLRVTVDYTNLSDSTKEFTLYVVPSYPGLFNMNSQQAVPQIGIITKEDILLAPNIHIDYYDAHNYYGGDFLGKIKEIGSKVERAAKGKTGRAFARAADKYLPDVIGTFVDPSRAEYVKGLTSQYKRLVGAGYSPAHASSLLGGAPLGAGMLGGKKMSGSALKGTKSQMQKKLMQRAIGM